MTSFRELPQVSAQLVPRRPGVLLQKIFGSRRSSPLREIDSSCSPHYMWYYACVRGFGGWLIEFWVRGQRRKARLQNRRRSCSGRSGAQATRHKSLISMIISDSSASFFEKTDRPSFQQVRQPRKTRKFSEQPPVWCLYCGSAWLAGSIAPNQTQSSHFWHKTVLDSLILTFSRWEKESRRTPCCCR